MRKHLNKLIFFAILFSATSVTYGGETITVIDATDAAQTAGQTPDWKLVENLTSINRNMRGKALFDGKNFTIILQADSRFLTNSLDQIGLNIWFNSAKNMKNGVQLRRERPARGKARSLFAGSSIAAMLPNAVKEKLEDFVPTSEYQPKLVAKRQRLNADVIVPSISAFFNDSTGAFYLTLPAASHIFPGGLFPFDKKGISKLEIEVGDQMMTRVMNFGGGRPGVSRARYHNAALDGERPQFEYHKFSLEIEMLDWQEKLGSLNAEHSLDLLSYLENLDRWTAASSNPRRRVGPNGSPMIMPVAVQAFLAAKSVRAASLDYFAAFLELTDNEKTSLHQDFSEQWRTEELTPVLVTLRTNFHESYLERGRWSIFLENGKRELFEATEVVELTPPLPEKARGGAENGRLMRQMFQSNSKQFVMLFPKTAENGQPIWHGSNQPLKLVIISEENPDLRTKLAWENLPRQ